MDEISGIQGPSYKGVFTTSEITRMLDISRRKVQSYMERHYIQPSIRKGEGAGSRRLWSRDDVIVIYVIKRCEQHGLAPRTLRLLGRRLFDDLRIGIERLLIVPSGDIYTEQEFNQAGSVGETSAGGESIASNISLKEISDLSTKISLKVLKEQAREKIEAFA